MQAADFERIAAIRAAVGYLGEKDQAGWWSSSFFASTGSAFLAPVFPRTQVVAQCQGVSGAASKILLGSEMTATRYTTQLQAGLGMIEETRSLLQFWDQGVEPAELAKAAVQSGRFPNMSARRVRNLVVECFSPRYLNGGNSPARWLKQMMGALATREFEQLLFLHTCRTNPILADFVRQVYWMLYSAGRETISNQNARDFVIQANDDGRTSIVWSETTIRRVSSYLTGCCADFGLLETGAKSVRRILPYPLSKKCKTRYKGEAGNSRERPWPERERNNPT